MKKVANGVKKIECRFYGKTGRWEMTAESTLKKGHSWSIPLDTKEMKKFFLDKFSDRLECIAHVKSGGMLAFSFGSNNGMSGTIINKSDLKLLEKK